VVVVRQKTCYQSGLFGGSGGWLIKKGRGRRRGERGVGIKEGEEKGRGNGGRKQPVI
jgi:hypothetical protein